MLDVFIDIETIPGGEMPPMSEVSPPGNMKKADTIKKWFAEQGKAAQEKLWRGQSLLSLKGRIICIGFAVGNNPIEALCWDNEEDLIRAFWERVKSQNEFSDNIRWVGFNIKSFDLNWLYHRAVKYGMKDLAIQISRKRYADSIVDIRELWNGADYQAKGKADEIAAFLGTERKTPGIDGSKVFGLWKAGKLSEIAGYCDQDVAQIRAQFGKLEGTF